MAALFASACVAAAAPSPVYSAAMAKLEAKLFLAPMAEPLVPTGQTTADEDNALLNSVAAWERRASPDDFSPLTGFLAAHPKSSWRVAVLTDLGLAYLHAGYLSRAVAAWGEAWRDGSGETGLRAHALVDRAVGELVRLDAELGREAQLAALLREIGSRPVVGPATERVKNGHEVLWLMQNHPKHLYLCGPMALKLLMLAQHRKPADVHFLDRVRAGPKGTSLAELSELANEGRFAAEIVFRKPGEKVPVPSIVHWKVGHFAAIAGKRNGRFKLEDPSFGQQSLWVTKGALDAEASGYFLVPADEAHQAGWREIAAKAAADVWGAGWVTGYSGNPKGGDDTDPDSGKPSNPPNCGMCGYGIEEERVSLNLTDTPVGYSPPIGPPVKVTLGYDQRDDNQTGNINYFNVGPKWTLSWLSFVQDTAGSPGINVTRYQRNGAVYAYTGYDTGTGAFTAQEDDASVLVFEPSGTYERFLRDGTVEIYQQSDGGAASRRVFLSKIVDPQGNTLTLNYDTSNGVRLTSLTDAAGRQTTFTYGGGNPLLITRITDPFGRSASLAYGDNGQLASITDVLGLTSTFSYDGSKLVNAMTTPYGTTQFAYDSTDAGPPRFLNIIDPLGYGEREETSRPLR